jgi:hypothetical protein
MGRHSNKHLLYASWPNEKALLAKPDSFDNILQAIMVPYPP